MLTEEEWQVTEKCLKSLLWSSECFEGFVSVASNSQRLYRDGQVVSRF